MRCPPWPQPGQLCCLSMAFLQSGPAAPLVSPPPTPQPPPSAHTRQLAASPLPKHNTNLLALCWLGSPPLSLPRALWAASWSPGLLGGEARAAAGVEGSWQAAHAGDGRPHPLVQTSPPRSRGASQLCEDNSWGSGSAKRNSGHVVPRTERSFYSSTTGLFLLFGFWGWAKRQKLLATTAFSVDTLDRKSVV